MGENLIQSSKSEESIQQESYTFGRLCQFFSPYCRILFHYLISSGKAGIIIIIIIVFSHQVTLMVFHWSLSNGKSPLVSRTLLSILAVLNNAVVWMVSTRPPTFKSSSPFNNPLVSVPKTPITIGIIVTFIFHSFFNSSARSRYSSFFSHSFSFILWSAGTAKSTIMKIPPTPKSSRPFSNPLVTVPKAPYYYYYYCMSDFQFKRYSR